MIGGLFTSTFLTLIVIPVVYSLVDDAKVRSRKAIGMGAEDGTPFESSTTEPAAS